MSVEVSKLIQKNTITNYILVFIRILQGILVTRWMIVYLGQEFYGFWGLLWTVFMYVLVLDFGFSKAAQKCTAEGVQNVDVNRYSRIVSAVFTMQWIMSLVIVLVSVLAAVYIVPLTHLENASAEKVTYLRQVLLVFSLGIAVTFPTGMFPEILVGLKNIYLRNYVLIAGKVLELTGIYALFKSGGSLLALTCFTTILNFSLNMFMFGMIKKQIPLFKLRLCKDWATLKELFDFSLFTYLYTIGSLLIHKTDRLVLSYFSGLDAAGIYQWGTRVPDIVQSMTSQYQENVAPFTAGLIKNNELEVLRNIILTGLRFAAWMISGAVGILLVAMPEVSILLFGQVTEQVIMVGRIMLLCAFFEVAFRSFGVKIMMMSGRHRLLCILGWAEAIANLSLSILLVIKIGLPGVLYGTLIPSVLLALLVMLPFYGRFVQLSLWQIIKKVYLMPLINAALVGGLAWYLQQKTPKDWWVFYQVLLVAVVPGLVYVVLSYFTLLSKTERQRLNHKLLHKIGRA